MTFWTFTKCCAAEWLQCIYALPLCCVLAHTVHSHTVKIFICINCWGASVHSCTSKHKTPFEFLSWWSCFWSWGSTEDDPLVIIINDGYSRGDIWLVTVSEWQMQGLLKQNMKKQVVVQDFCTALCNCIAVLINAPLVPGCWSVHLLTLGSHSLPACFSLLVSSQSGCYPQCMFASGSENKSYLDGASCLSAVQCHRIYMNHCNYVNTMG